MCKLNNKQEQVNLKRRQFLSHKITLATVAGTAATLVYAGGKNNHHKAKQESQQTGSYRETEHIKTYYKVADF